MHREFQNTKKYVNRKTNKQISVGLVQKELTNKQS